MLFLAKKPFSKFIPPNPVGSGWEKMEVSFAYLYIKIILSEIATNPLTQGVGVAKPEFFCISGHLM